MSRSQPSHDQRRFTSDRVRRETTRERRSFDRVRRAEAQYARALRGIARHVGGLVRSFDPTDPRLTRTLTEYSKLIEPWARNQAERMLADVSRRDEAVWAGLSRDMSRALRDEIRHAPTGHMLQRLLEEQVRYITSLPLEAAERVQSLALRGLSGGERPEVVRREILRTGEVTISRANLIARTETARAASGLVEVRARFVGSEGYIWESSRDSDVRPDHRKLAGKFIRWDDPPVAGTNGMRYHAGQGPNCRCWPRPVIPEEGE